MRFSCSGFLTLVVAVTTATSAMAMSIYDIIQLSRGDFSNEQIVALIESTDSAFELEAEDIPRLKQYGVDEVVIRAMLERASADSLENESVPKPSNQLPESWGGRPVAVDDTPGGAYDPWILEANVPARDGRSLIDFQIVAEEGTGEHTDVVLTLSGLEILMLRDQGAYPSVTERAQEVRQRLEAVLALGNGILFPGFGGKGPSVLFQSAATHQRITILDVDSADARSYEIRSGRPVTRELLATYWSDLLADFISIAMGRRPHRAVSLHDGISLELLYEALRGSVGRGGGLQGAAELLPSSVQDRLERLVATVPADYELQGGLAD